MGRGGEQDEGYLSVLEEQELILKQQLFLCHIPPKHPAPRCTLGPGSWFPGYFTVPCPHPPLYILPLPTLQSLDDKHTQ